MDQTLMEQILVVAATSRELADAHGWRTLRCGVGPVDAAVNTAAAIAESRPRAILHVGIAGCRRDATLAPPMLVIGRTSWYCDLGVPATWAPHTLPADPALLNAARRVLPTAPVLDIGTSARVGGTLAHESQLAVEAMEGFGVLRAAQLAGVPAIEIRAIANHIDETDRALWQFDNAFAAITAVTASLVEEFAACGR